MEKPVYPFKVLDNGFRFDFESVSDSRTIQKSIEFKELEIENLYNLALIDVNFDGTVDDNIISNNGDMELVLATVFRAIQIFLIFNPNARILFLGSSASRTRLYRIIINKYLKEFELKYEVHGINNWISEPFMSNKNYDAFLIYIRTNK